MLTIHSSGQTIFNFTHMEGITLVACEEVDKVTGGANGMDVDRIVGVGDKGSEGHAAGVYGTGFTAESLARVGAWN